MKSLALFAVAILLMLAGSAIFAKTEMVGTGLAAFALAACVFLAGLVVNHREHTGR